MAFDLWNADSPFLGATPMELLFSPTIALMSRLKYPAKFGAMGLLRRADSQLLAKLQMLALQ